MIARTVLVALVSALALGSCGDANDTAAPRRPTTTANATTTSSEGATTTAPTSDPQPVQRLDVNSRLSFDGVGPVHAGMTPDQVEAAAGVAMTRGELPACSSMTPSDEPAGVEFLFPSESDLEFIFVREGSRLRSSAGIAVGDSEDAVLAAHPDAEVVNPGVEVHRVVVREPGKSGRRLIYEIERGRVAVMWSGPFGAERTDEVCS